MSFPAVPKYRLNTLLYFQRNKFFIVEWSNHTLTSFNFLWMEVPTYRPYLEETSYENSLKIEQLGFDAELSTLNSAFNAVDAKSREVLGIIIENNLENRNNKKFRGKVLQSASVLSFGLSQRTNEMCCFRYIVGRFIYSVQEKFKFSGFK